MSELAIRFQEFRKAMGMTRRVLAARLGVTEREVARWERRGPDALACARMADLAEVFSRSESRFWWETSWLLVDAKAAKLRASPVSALGFVCGAIAGFLGNQNPDNQSPENQGPENQGLKNERRAA